MSSAGTAETFSNAAVAENGVTTTAKGNAELTAQRTRVAEVEAHARSNEPPKSVLKSGSTESHVAPLLSGQADVMRLNAGGVRAKDGTIKPPDVVVGDKNSEEDAAIYEAARTQIDTLTQRLAYTQALAAMHDKGITATEVLDKTVMAELGKRGINITELQYKDARTAAIADARNRLNPEAYDGVDPADVDKWIEDVYLSGDQYRTTIASQMEAQYKTLNAIPKREIDPAYEAAKAASKAAEKQRNESAKVVADRLRSELPGGLPAAIDAKLTDLVNKGASTDEILRQLQAELIADAKFPPIDISTFQELLLVENIYITQHDEYIRNSGSTVAKNKDTAAKKQYEDKRDALTKAGKLPQFQRFSKILQLTNSQRTQAGYNPNSVGEQLSTAVKAQGELKTANDTIKDNEATRTESDLKWRAERNRIVSQATTEMDEITSHALDAVWTARVEAFGRKRDAASIKEQEDAKKAGETRLAEEIKKLDKQQDKNGIGRDEARRKLIVNYAQLGKDVRFLSYHTKDGIQRLMLRDLGGITVDDMAYTPNPDGTRPQRAFDWKNDDLSQLSEKDTKALEKLMTSHEKAYRDKLLGDYTHAKGMGGLHGKDGQHSWTNSRNLRLQDHEFAALAEHFNTDLEAAAGKSEEMKTALEDAKKKGIKGKGLFMYVIGLLFAMGAPVKDKFAVR